MLGTGLTGGNRVLFEVFSRLACKNSHRYSLTFISFPPPSHNWFKFSCDVDIEYIMEKFFLNYRIPYEKYINFAEKSIITMFFNKKIAKYIDLYDFDILFATHSLTSFIVYNSNAKKKFYYIQHFEPLTIRLFPPLYKFLFSSYLLPLEWIVNSSFVQKYLFYYFRRKGHLVLPGVDYNFWSKFIREDKSIEDKRITILALGKSDPIKGLRYLFEALKIVKKVTKKEINLILYGSEPYLASKSPVKTIYVTKPSDYKLGKLYYYAHLTVVPSLYESSPLPPLESMATGTPVITTKYGTEDICKNLENSIVVEPKCPKCISDALTFLIDHPDIYEKIRRKGIETAKIYTWDRTVQQVETIIEDALKSE